MSELDLITFAGILESWHAFGESRFNISFSIFGFEVLLNLKYLFEFLFTFYCNDTRIIFKLFLWVFLLDPQYDQYLLTCSDILEYLDLKLLW